MKDKKGVLHGKSGVIAAIFVLIVCYRTVIACVLPFAAAFVLGGFTRKYGEKLAKKMRMSRPFSVAAVTGTLTAALIAAVVTVVKEGIKELLSLIRGFDAEKVGSMIVSAANRLIGLVGNYVPTLFSDAADRADVISSAVDRVTAMAFDGFVSAATALPGILLSMAVTVIAMFYFALDHGKIAAYARDFLPERLFDGARTIRDACVSTAAKMLGAYGAIFCLTFTELLTGFLILRMPYAVLLAFGVAVVDILPILGTGTVLLPWAVVCFVFGKTGTGLALAVLYGVIAVVRQIAEPRIVGKSVGLHPLVTLSALYVGGVIGGVVGILTLPLLVSVAATALTRKTDA